MKPPLRLFSAPCIVQEHEDGTVDVEFSDSAKNGDRRCWWISNNGSDELSEPGEWYGTLSRSETDESPFDFHSHELPKKFAAFLGAMVQHNLESKL